MAYAEGNPKTKKALKALVDSGKKVRAFNPGLGGEIKTGEVCIEGPHYPEPHRWYARAKVVDGIIVNVK